MDKKLEARITKLERMMDRKCQIKNESEEDPIAQDVYRTADTIGQLVTDLCKRIAYDNISNIGDIEIALSTCESVFSDRANFRLNSILKDRKRKEF